MAKKAKIALPIAPLSDLITWWQSQSTRGIIIGGLAAGLLGRPRVTRDVDVLVMLAKEQWSEFLDSGSTFGFVPRMADALTFAHEARVLLLRHQPTSIDLDVSLGSLPFEEEAVERAMIVKVAGVAVPISTPEDLIIMKAVAHRDRDWLDIEGILSVHPKLDLARVRHWVQIFADALETPELCGDLEQRLVGRPQKRPRKKRTP